MSFSTSDLNLYIKHHALSPGASDYIRRAAIGVSRDVGQSGYTCVVTEFPSRKMGTSIVTESRRGELAYAILLEYDEGVVAYYEQPPKVDCRRTTRKGSCVTRSHHPDFLVLSVLGPLVVQVKAEQKLQEKIVSQACDWVHQDDTYRDLPAERALEKYDLVHRVVSTSGLPPIRIANLRLLLHARHSYQPSSAHPSIETVRAQFKQRSMMSLATLAEKLRIIDLTPLLHFIDVGQLHTILNTQLLTDLESCQVALIPELLELEQSRLIKVGADVLSASLDWCPPQKQAEQGLKNLQRFHDDQAPARTKRDHRRRIEKAAANGQSPLQALTPKTYRSGNRKRKRPDSVIEHAENVIRRSLSSVERLSNASIYRIYRESADSELPTTQPLSRNSISKIVKTSSASAAYGRGGRRAANAAASPTPVEERVGGPTRPFELATCDHYLADIECVLIRSIRKKYTRRGWVTVLRDIHTGVMLSIWLGFRAPSRTCCAMVLRGCVRRHGRLPEGIVVDRGAEFRSVYFSALLAHQGVAAVYRPTSHPRYGSEAERFFGQFKSQWLDLRPGNTTNPSEGRAVSGSHKAAVAAELTIADLLTDLWEFCDWQNSNPGATKTVPPALLLHECLTKFPFSGIPTEFNAAFAIATAVDETRIKLDPARGLKIGASHYWHPALADPRLRASRIEVRREPEDETIVYARVSQEWISCQSSGQPYSTGKSLLARTASAVFALDGANVREEARRDADIDLVRRVRNADEEIAATRVERDALPKHEPSSSYENEREDNLEVTPLATTRWGEAP